MMDPSTWLTPPRPFVPFYWKIFEKSLLIRREKPTFSLRKWSRTVWRKWFLWTSTKLSRCSVDIMFAVFSHTFYQITCFSVPAAHPFWSWIKLFLCWQVDDELEIKAYYAGHVLGAAMVHIKVGSESVVYTVSANMPELSQSVNINLQKKKKLKNVFSFQGDYNMTPDRHLGWVAFPWFTDNLLGIYSNTKKFEHLFIVRLCSLFVEFALMNKHVNSQKGNSENKHQTPHQCYSCNPNPGPSFPLRYNKSVWFFWISLCFP